MVGTESFVVVGCDRTDEGFFEFVCGFAGVADSVAFLACQVCVVEFVR